MIKVNSTHADVKKEVHDTVNIEIFEEGKKKIISRST